jgi:hypothetical protein
VGGGDATLQADCPGKESLVSRLTCARFFSVALLFLVNFVANLQLQTRVLASPPQNPWQPSGFQGAWCAQGDPNKQCSITVNGVFLTFTNESGSTSSGHYVGMGQNVVSADQWNFVQGTLSPDATRISWTNGTFWARCSSSGGGGHGRHIPNVDGTWYRGGNRSQSCYIRQRKKKLTLTNESGQGGTGQTDGRWHLISNWSGTQVNGSISSDGNTIYWDNGTSWSR